MWPLLFSGTHYLGVCGGGGCSYQHHRHGHPPQSAWTQCMRYTRDDMSVLGEIDGPALHRHLFLCESVKKEKSFKSSPLSLSSLAPRCQPLPPPPRMYRFPVFQCSAAALLHMIVLCLFKSLHISWSRGVAALVFSLKKKDMYQNIVY